MTGPLARWRRRRDEKRRREIADAIACLVEGDGGSGAAQGASRYPPVRQTPHRRETS